MAMTYGYFNSIDGDRTYDADQMSEYFDGLVSNGVYESVGGALQVLAGSGMNVNVQTGRGIIKCKWLKNDAVLTLAITSAHALLDRWTAVVLKLDITNRSMTITTKDGTPASSPEKPTMQNDSSAVELCLAYIYVSAGATSITHAQITDQRGSSLCPWVTGLITQVNTSTLFLQYQTAYEQMLSSMSTWQASMKSQFDAWLEDLTDELNVDTYIEEYDKSVTYQSAGSQTISLNMTGYTYTSGDIIQVFINGLLGVAGTDYTLNTSAATPTVTPTATAEGTDVEITVYKSRIGYSTT